MSKNSANEDPEINDENAPLISQPFKEQKWRYCTLLLFFIMNSFAEFSFYGLPLISSQVQQLYNLSVSSFGWFSSAFILMGIFTSIPSTFLIARLGVKTALTIAVMLCAIGAWLRVSLNHSFVYCFAGQYVIASSYLLFRNSITEISAHWFRPTQRSFSTALLQIDICVISVLGMYVPTLYINQQNITPAREPYFRDRLRSFYLLQAIMISVLGIFCIALYRQRPRQSVSPSSNYSRENIRESLCKLVKNTQAMLLTLQFSLFASVSIVFILIEESLLQHYGVTSANLGIFNLVSIPLSIITMLGVGWCSGASGQYKLPLILNTLISLLSLVLVMLLLKFKVNLIYGIAFLLVQVCMSASFSISYEFLAELTFPIAQTFSLGLLSFIFKSLCLLLTQVSFYLLSKQKTIEILLLFILWDFLSLILILIVKEKLQRRNLDLPSELASPH